VVSTRAPRSRKPSATKVVTTEAQKSSEPKARWSAASFSAWATRKIKQWASSSKEAKRPFTIEQLSVDLESVLRCILSDQSWKKQLLTDSYYLPNGFLAMRLLEVDGYVLRLHIFNQSQKVEGLHSHKWEFESKILTGRLVSETWRQARDQETSQLVTGMFSRKVSNQPGAKQSKLVTLLRERVNMVYQETTQHTSGQCYFMTTDIIHRVLKSDSFTSTLVLTHPASTPNAEGILYDILEDHADVVKRARETDASKRDAQEVDAASSQCASPQVPLTMPEMEQWLNCLLVTKQRKVGH
jgi:hypothetical protein